MPKINRLAHYLKIKLPIEERGNLTAKTYLHIDDWVELFQEVGYQGDYYRFIAE